MRLFYRKHRQAIWIALIVFILIFLVYIGIHTDDIDYSVTKNSVYAGTAFGTGIKKTLYAKDETVLDDTNVEIDKCLKTLESRLSVRMVDSEITLCNRNYSPGGKYELSDDITSYIEKELKLYKDTDGAYNPCMRPVTGLWGIEDGDTEIPSDSAIQKALACTNADNIEIYDKGVIIKEDNMMLDFGATGKGIACDEIRKILKDTDLQGAVISIGGSICVYGDKGDDKYWHIGVQDPRAAEGETLGILDVPGTVTVSTSGDYEKYFDLDGKRYHHIIDPATGYPANSGLISVTVISEDGLLSDGLSTAFFVMGLDDAMKYAEKHSIDAVFVTRGKEVYTTDGLKKRFRLTASGYTLQKYEK